MTHFGFVELQVTWKNRPGNCVTFDKFFSNPNSGMILAPPLFD